MTNEEYIKQALENKNASPIRRNQFNPATAVDSFKPKFSSEFGSNFTSQFGFNPDLDTSDGLYRIADKVGLKDQADKIVADNSGEELKKIFSGGFISDTFDVLNILSYGTVGLLKGKGFVEGVKNRESFSDKDSLGQYGWAGVGAGIVLDIFTDPLTYVAPLTVLRKIPGVVKVSKLAKEAVIGREVTKLAAGADEAYQALEGGVMNGKARELIQKVSFMFGADPVFKETYDRMHAMIGRDTTRAMGMVKQLSKLDPKVTENLFTSVMDERLGREVLKRTPIEDLQRALSAEDFAKVKPVWENIDALGKKMVDLGLLGSDKYEENLGRYIKNVYAEHELAKNKGFYGFKKVKIAGGKKLQEGLDVSKLTRIEDPAFVTGRTMEYMIKDIYNAEFLNRISKFASDKAGDGLVQVPDTRRFITTGGDDAQLKQYIGEINTKLTPLFKQLKATFKDDAATIAEIRRLEKEIGSLDAKKAMEMFKIENEGAIGKTTRVKKGTAHRPMPDRLEPLAAQARKFDTFEDFVNSGAGRQMQTLWNEGVLFRNGFGKLTKDTPGIRLTGGEQAMRDFFDSAKKQFTPGSVKVTEAPIVGNVEKLTQLSKDVEKLMAKLSDLKEIDKRSINDSFRFLEDRINKLQLDKDDLIENLHNNKMASLAGKYLPKEMFDYIDEVINPTEAFGNRIMSEFKYMKVVLNPGTHVRNMLSNRVLNYWKLGIGPHRVDKMLGALSEIKNKGKYWREWESVGGGADTYAAAELKAILEGPETTFLKGKLGNYWTKTKQKIGDIYQYEESLAKMEAFIAMRKKGHGVEEAFKMSQAATFNYAQVTPFVRKLRTAIWGMPFITFALKAAPITIETAMKNPQRISAIGKIRNSLFNAADIQETQAELEAEPAYVKEGFYMKLPYKDENGRSMYFDLTYIIPFGDLIGGGIVGRQLNTETGTKEALPMAIAGNNPVFQLMKELSRNQTFTGEQIFKESDDTDKVGRDILLHITRTFVPPWMSAQMPSGYDRATGELNFKGLAQTSEAGPENTKRNLQQELLAYLGIKQQPFQADVMDSYQEWNMKKGLQTLLLENNVIENFSRNYIPK